MKNNVWQFIPVVKKACSLLNIVNLVCEITLAHASSEKSDMAGNFHDIYYNCTFCTSIKKYNWHHNLFCSICTCNLVLTDFHRKSNTCKSDLFNLMVCQGYQLFIINLIKVLNHVNILQLIIYMYMALLILNLLFFTTGPVFRT